MSTLRRWPRIDFSIVVFFLVHGGVSEISGAGSVPIGKIQGSFIMEMCGSK